MIQVTVLPNKGEATLHLDENGIERLREAIDEAGRGNKVFLGDPGAMLILRPTSFQGAEEYSVDAPVEKKP